MKLSFYGHACFGMEINGTNLVTDPFITPNELAQGKVDLANVKADFILQSHGHMDHIADTVALAKQNDATVVSNYEIINWLAANGWEKGHPMNHGGKWAFEFGSVKYVNAVHTSSMPDGSYGGNPGGFVIEAGGQTVYFAGDTALTYDMKLIAEEFRLDFAILPIGDNFTMGIDDAVKAADFIGCNKIVGMHFDTFGYIKIDHAEAVKKFADKGKELILMEIGETREI